MRKYLISLGGKCIKGVQFDYISLPILLQFYPAISFFPFLAHYEVGAKYVGTLCFT